MDFLDRLIDLALDEDLSAAGDVTTQALIPEGSRGRAELWAKEALVLAGSAAFARVFTRLEPEAEVRFTVSDGARIAGRQTLASVEARLRTLLIGERTALNILQRTCGIATLAARAADAVRGTPLRILDTRKTSPGMRALSKEAVRAGGASNHRFGLFDGVLIKDNHLVAVGGDVEAAVKRARAHAPQLVKVEVEVTRLDQLPAAIAGGADVVLLDNMDDRQVAEAVRMAAGRVRLEVSGNVTVERLPRLAQLGVDFVSMGALTHSARAMDLSLEIVPLVSPSHPGR
jgi:nicotinate-nucleotide pyrophosphorylase (carboxylating)